MRDRLQSHAATGRIAAAVQNAATYRDLVNGTHRRHNPEGIPVWNMLQPACLY